MSEKIDMFNHIFPKPFFERLQDVTVNKGAIKRWLNIPFLHDLDVRFRMLEEFGDDYRQMLSLSAPPIESINPDRADHARSRDAGQRFDGGPRSPLSRTASPASSLRCRSTTPAESVAELERAVNALRRASACRCSRTSTACRSTTIAFFPLFETPTGCAARSSCIPRAAPASRTMPRESKVEVRDLVDLRLALRDERRDAAAGLLRSLRPPARASRSSRTIWAR